MTFHTNKINLQMKRMYKTDRIYLFAISIMYFKKIPNIHIFLITDPRSAWRISKSAQRFQLYYDRTILYC